MELKYIIGIVCGGLFILLFLIFLGVAMLQRRKHAETMENIEKMYSDKNLAKMEYDCAVYDEKTEKRLSGMANGDGQVTIDEIVGDKVATADVFSSVDTEGVEEIKGNYKP